jgi:hypothetical protein
VLSRDTAVWHIFFLRVETDVKRTSLFSVLARSLHEIKYWDICQPKTK